MKQTIRTSILALSLVCAIVFSFLCSFMLVKTADEAGGLIGSGFVLINESTGEVQAAQFREEIIKFAQSQQIDVILTVPDPTKPDSERTFYIAPASSVSPGAQWLRDGYPNFSRSTRVTVHHLTEYEVNDARGYYVMKGDSDAAKKFLAMANDNGFSGEIFISDGFNYLRTESAAVIIVVIFILLLVLSLIHIITRSRQLAVASMNGQRAFTFVCREFIQGFKDVKALLALLLVAGLVFLWFYNKFHYLHILIYGFLALLALYLLSMFAAALLCVKVLGKTPLIAAIKGAIPGKQLSWGAYLIRFVVLLFACSLFFSTIALTAQVASRKNEQQLWQQRSQTTAIFVTSGAGYEYFTDLGPALRELERRGEVIVVQPDWNIGATASPADLPQILVNSGYAQAEFGLAPASEHTVRILYPADAPQEEVDKAIQSVRQDTEGKPEYQVELLPQPADFTAFSYQSSVGSFSHPLEVSRPIVTVVPPGLSYISDHNVAGLSTRRELLLKNEQAAQELAANPKLVGVLAGWRPARDQWQQQTAQIAAESRAAVLNLAIIFIVLTTIVGGCVIAYSLRNHDRLRAAFLIGMPFTRAYFSFLVVEAVFVVFPLLYLGYRQWSYLEAIKTSPSRVVYLSLSEAVTPMISVLFVCLALMWCGLATVFASRRYHTDTYV